MDLNYVTSSDIPLEFLWLINGWYYQRGSFRGIFFYPMKNRNVDIRYLSYSFFTRHIKKILLVYVIRKKNLSAFIIYFLSTNKNNEIFLKINDKVKVKCSLFPSFNVFTFTKKKIKSSISYNSLATVPSILFKLQTSLFSTSFMNTIVKKIAG